MRKVLTVILALFPAVLFGADLKISVIDKDLDFPLEGAKITLEQNHKNVTFADENGNALLSLPDSISSGTLRVSLPGYKDVLKKFSKGDERIVITMSLSDVIEGKELVVKRSVPEKTEEKVGVAKVITKEQMHTTANIGLVEDCMASVRTLPGVS
ncbi:MAG: hypothetical protein II146_01720, partial [Treponema sp.]|nr:hypothetical protein [Treponema sp.]